MSESKEHPKVMKYSLDYYGCLGLMTKTGYYLVIKRGVLENRPCVDDVH